MKKLIVLFYFGAFVCAKPSYHGHHGVGAIYKGPNSETIVKGPDGSVITSEAVGGAIAVEGPNAIAEAAAASAAAVANTATAHQIVQQTAASAAAASHTVALSQTPIVVPESVVVPEPSVALAEPILVAKGVDTAALDGPSGSILRHGENAIISGPASTTIRDGRVIASIPKPELSTVVVHQPQPAVVDATLVSTPAVGVSHGAVVTANVADVNAHLTDANLINGANLAALQISEANRAALAHEINSQALNAANAAALAEANRQINAANVAHSQEVLARANLEAQAVAQANLEVQLAHGVAPQVSLADINAANAAVIAQSEEALAAKANLEAQLAHAVTPQLAIADVNAINSAALAHSQEALARANLEAHLAAERNAVAAHQASHNVVAFRPSLNPVITQGNQIISDAIFASTPAPVVEVMPISAVTPIVSTTVKPIIVPARAKTIVSSTVTPTPVFVKTSPTQNVIVSSTLKPVQGLVTGFTAPVTALDGGQVVYQSSSSSSSQAESHSSSSSSSSSVNVVNGGIGGVAGIIATPLIGPPVGVASSDLAQWQESFSKSGHVVGKSVLAAHRGIIH